MPAVPAMPAVQVANDLVFTIIFEYFEYNELWCTHIYKLGSMSEELTFTDTYQDSNLQPLGYKTRIMTTAPPCQKL